MPREIFDEEIFIKLSESSVHCRVKRLRNDVVKLKLRAKKLLYTFKTNPDDAERLLKQINCDVIEL